MQKTTLAALMPLIQEKFANGETFSFMPNGVSMRPTIVGGRDPVTIAKSDGNIEKYDIILFHRKNGQYVLHRVLGKDEKGYILCGDNEPYAEHGITPDIVVAVLTRYVHDGTIIDAGSKQFYRHAKKAFYTRPLRHLKADFGKIKRKIINK